MKLRLGVLFLVFGLSMSIILLISPPAKAQQQIRDCDINAVIRCGVLTLAELQQAYQANQQGNVQMLYKAFGITSASQFTGLVNGTVTKNGQVFVGSKQVGTGAITAGRMNMPGSVPILNGAFFRRPPSVSFAHNALEAFVKMNGNQLVFAIIKSCGNPVVAFPVLPPTPKPSPRPTPTPPSTPTVTPVSTPPKVLPSTGAGNYISLFAVVSSTGAIAHNLLIRRRRLS